MYFTFLLYKVNGGVATPPPYLSTLKIYPNPGEGPIPPVFASK